MNSGDRSTFSISWRNIAIGSLLLNLAAIAAISTISARSDSGALNTIALSLAIIAFVCQLLVYTVQSWQSSEQLRRSEELHASTLGLISDARARIENTESMVQTQHSELLRIVAQKSEGETLKASFTNDDEREDPAEVAVSQVQLSRDDSDRDASEYGRLVTQPPAAWPERSAFFRDGVRELEELSEYEVAALALAASDHVRSTASGSEPGLSYGDTDARLIEMGLVREISASSHGQERRMVTTTEQGNEVSAIFLAPWPPPEALELDKTMAWNLRNNLDPRIKKTLGSLRRSLDAARKSKPESAEG